MKLISIPLAALFAGATLFLAAVMPAAAAPSNGAVRDADALIRRMQAAEKDISTLSFDYRQETLFETTGERQVAAGTVKAGRSGRLRIDQTKPLEQSIVTDGKTVWIYTPAYGQVYRGSWETWVEQNSVPVTLLGLQRDWKALRERYSVSLAGKEGEDHLLRLVPRDGGGWDMTITVDGGSYLPEAVKVEAGGTTVTTRSVDIKVNPDLGERTFTFTVPDGVEVLDLE